MAYSASTATTLTFLQLELQSGDQLEWEFVRLRDA